jgi:TonB-linked SusC/RagA family outer membrane protein
MNASLITAGLFAFAVVSAAAQEGNGRIVGTVTDAESGRPLSGAQVYLDGTTLGVLTSSEGRYTLPNVRPGRYTVMVQIIGYSQGRQAGAAVTAGQTTTIDFRMTTTVLSLQEVVVTGVTDPIAGVKAPIAIARVSKENIATVPTTSSALAAIQGKVAGASIIRGSGAPGSGVNILLRTPTSIQQSNSPLFVVDGVILSQSINGTTIDLEALDIESFEVIKGAAAASLYGSRAAAGVISITTSRGKNVPLDQTRITVRTEVGSSQAPTGMPLSRAHHYLQRADGMWIDTAGREVTRELRVIAADNIMDNPYATPVFDNVSQFFKPAAFSTISVNLRHSSQTTNFLTSVNQFNERGSLVTNDGFVRRDFRINLDHRLRDDFSLAISGYHSRYARDLLLQGTGEGGLFWDLLLTEPDVNLGARDANGNLLQQPDRTIPAENPLFGEQEDDEDEWRTRTLGSIDVRYSPFTWLNFASNFSYDRSDTKTQFYRPKGRPLSIEDDDPADGSLDKEDDYSDALNASLAGTVLRNIGKLTTRTTLRGLIEREERTVVEANGDNFYVMGIPDLSVAATRAISSQFTDIRSTAYSVNTGLDYDGKYIVDALIRRDGSSLFGPDARWQTYGRVAGAWRMASENFWPWKNTFNEFKLRYAVGTAGNRPGFSSQYEVWTVSSTGTVGKTTLGNRELKPEDVIEHEAGIDMIFKNRYSLQLTYARQETRDQLIQLPLPAVVGYPAQWVNTGVNTGKTFEMTFEAQVVNRPGFSWNTTLVADRMRSKITEWNRACFFDGLQNICGGSSLSEMWGNRFLTSPGEIARRAGAQANEFQVNDDGYLVWVGAGNTWRDGLSKSLWGTTGVVNGTTYFWGEPILETDSLGFNTNSRIGESLPDFSMGWLNNVNWGGLSIHTQFHSQIGGNVYNGSRQRLHQHLRHGDLDQTGKPAERKKTIAYYQRLYNANVNTTHFVENATYLKLRELSVQYRLGKSLLSKVGLGGTEGLSLGLIGRNIFTWTNYTGFDPEVGSVLERRDTFGYPNVRNLTFTAEITF